MVDVKTETFLYSIINITTGKYCWVAFICLATRHHFIHTFKKLELPCTAEKIRTARECCSIAFIFNRHTYILSARNEEVRAILFSIISSIPLSSNFRKNGYQLWVQCFLGSFAWINVSYHWSMFSKATINQLQWRLSSQIRIPEIIAPKACILSSYFLSEELTFVPTALCVVGNRGEKVTPDPPGWEPCTQQLQTGLAWYQRYKKNARKVRDSEAWFIQ